MTAAPLIEGHLVDGYLVDAYRKDIGNGRFWIVGTVYHDRKGRFEDGSVIHTSTVMRLIECRAIPRFAHAADAITMNSRYRIINWSDKTEHKESEVMGKPRFTREIATFDGAIKLAVKVTPDDNTKVVLEDASINFAATLDPKAAHDVGQALIKGARLAALNAVLDNKLPEIDPIRGGELQ